MTESSPTVREYTVLHCAWHAAAAGNGERRYWNTILDDVYNKYRAAGGDRIEITKGWPFKVKAPAGWLTPGAPLSVKTTQPDQRADRLRHELIAEHEVGAMLKRLAET